MRSKDEMKICTNDAALEGSSSADIVIENIEKSFYSRLSPVLSFRSNGSDRTNDLTSSFYMNQHLNSLLDEDYLYSSMNYQQIQFADIKTTSSKDSQFVLSQAHLINIADMNIEQIKSIDKNQLIMLNKELSCDKIRAIPTERIVCSENFAASVNGDDRYRIYCIPSSVKRIILESNALPNINGILRSIKSKNYCPEIVDTTNAVLSKATENDNVLILPLMTLSEIASISASTVTIDNGAISPEKIKAIPVGVTKVVVADLNISADCYRSFKAATIELYGDICLNKIKAIPDCVKSIIFNKLSYYTIQKIIKDFQSRDCWPEIVLDKEVVLRSGTILQSELVKLFQSKISENSKLNEEILLLKKEIALHKQNSNKHSSSSNLESLEQQIYDQNSSCQILSSAKRAKHKR